MSTDSFYPPISTSTDFDRTLDRTTSSSISVSLWASFLSTAKLSVESSKSLLESKVFAMDALETREWLSDPALEEIRRRINHPKVKAVMRGDRMLGRQPVYMISGIKIAKNLRINLASGTLRSGALGNEVPIPTPAGDVGIGANFGGEKGREDTESWRIEGDVVFAYQLLKIQVKGWKGEKMCVDEWRSKAAYLCDDEDMGSKDECDDGNGEIAEVDVADMTVEGLRTMYGEGVFRVDKVQSGEEKVEVVSFADTQ
jgi:hypothetical protein